VVTSKDVAMALVGLVMSPRMSYKEVPEAIAEVIEAPEPVICLTALLREQDMVFRVVLTMSKHVVIEETVIPTGYVTTNIPVVAMGFTVVNEMVYVVLTPAC
jgi:hypothetical protein